MSNQYDLSDELLNGDLNDLTIDELEDDMLAPVIASDSRSRNTLDIIYASLGILK